MKIKENLFDDMDISTYSVWKDDCMYNTYAYRLIELILDAQDKTINPTILKFVGMYSQLVKAAETQGIFSILPSYINDKNLTYLNSKKEKFIAKYKIKQKYYVYLSEAFRRTFTYRISPSKLWMKVIPNAKAEDAAEFLALYNFYRLPENQYIIKEVKGTDILKYYDVNNYYRHSGILGSSCMRHKSVNHFMKIYANNPEQISMVVILDIKHNLLLARALVWRNVTLTNMETDKEIKNITFVDRIYCVDQTNHEPYIQTWADEREYYTRGSAAGFSGRVFNAKSGVSAVSLQVQLQHLIYEHYPYTDTFGFLNTSTKSLTSERTKYSLHSTKGEIRITTLEYPYDYYPWQEEDKDVIFNALRKPITKENENE